MFYMFILNFYWFYLIRSLFDHLSIAYLIIMTLGIITNEFVLIGEPGVYFVKRKMTTAIYEN